MRRSGVLALVLAPLSVVGVVTARRLLQDDDRREALRRRQRVYRLTARRAAHFASVKLRGARADEEQRAALEEQFAIRSAQDVAAVLGNMKGAIMKGGQMISFIAENLPPEARAALSTLQADVEPMAPSLAEKVVEDELGAPVDKLFLDWETIPIAAASIGQVHRATMRDGRLVAIKVQYPGVDRMIKGDLDNFEQIFGMVASVALKGVDISGIANELRARMADELDYRIEAYCQTEFVEAYAGHPFIHIPKVVPERSTQRVLTSEWVDGMTFAQFEEQADEPTKQKAAEVLFRFAEGAIHLHGVFNGDPHPGNYRFHPDGTVSFLDFGLVKRWTKGELEDLSPILDAILARDARAAMERSVTAGFLPPDHGLDPQHLLDYYSPPYRAFMTDHFTYDRQYVTEALTILMDVNGPYKDVIQKLNVPPSYVILDRVVWGLSALLGRLGASGPWRDILNEYRHGGPPATELGEQEAAWRATHPRPTTPRAPLPATLPR